MTGGDRRRSVLLAIFVAVLIWRLILCFQVPLGTSDVYRHLGFASHAFDPGISVYTTKAGVFADEPWHRMWANSVYLYPPVTLIFFYAFSLAGAGIVWVKLALTLIEVACASIVRRRISDLAAVLYFCSPVSIWYASHEGQFEPLQALFILLTIHMVLAKRWGRAGACLALAIQVKQFGVLLVPWIAWRLWQAWRAGPDGYRKVRSLAVGILGGFVPFAIFYLQEPALLFTPLAAPAVYSPYAWNFLDPERFQWMPLWLAAWNALFTYGILLVLLAAVARHLGRDRGILFQVLPAVSFWSILKSLDWAQPWYAIAGAPFVVCLSTRRRLCILLLTLGLLLGAGSALQLAGTSLGPRELPETVELMRGCMYGCRF